MHDAARDFQAQFTLARFDVVRCMPLMRLPVGGGPGDLTDAQVDARRRVGKALDALGGLGSPAGSCVWHVVGLQRSIREWAMRQGWGGRPVRIEQAQGILVAALGMLAGWYGYNRQLRVSDCCFAVASCEVLCSNCWVRYMLPTAKATLGRVRINGSFSVPCA